MDKKGSFDPRTPGMRATEAIDSYQRATQAKIEKELFDPDADPQERDLLADMLHKNPYDPSVEALVTKRGNAAFEHLAPNDMGLSRKVDRIVSDMLGENNAPIMSRVMATGAQNRADADFVTASMGETSAGEKLLAAVGAPDKPNGDAQLKKALDLSIASDKLVTSTKNASEQLEKLNGVLARINANSSALKTPGPR
jgi:hypothetical protein